MSGSIFVSLSGNVVLCDFCENNLPILTPMFFGNSVSSWIIAFRAGRVMFLYAPQKPHEGGFWSSKGKVKRLKL